MNGVVSLVERITQRVDTASEDVARQLTLSLRTLAIAAGWPLDIANMLEVVYEDGTFAPAWPRSMNEKIRDLEFGYSGEPNPVLRRFANRVEKMAYLRLDREMSSWQ